MRSLPALLVAIVLSACAPDIGVEHAALQGATGFVDGSYMGRDYKVYVPTTFTGTAMPLVLMLHGCTQTPASFAAATAMNTLAEQRGFLALYPEQPQSANSEECWTWFDSADQARGSGEPAQLVALMGSVTSTYPAVADQTYVVGFSAGAAMAVILGATYPDVFSGITVASGLEFAAATSLNQAFNAQSSGGPSPSTQGMTAYTAMGAHAKRVRVQVIHGTSDTTVAPINGDQVLSQWAETDDLASDGVDDDNITDTADATANGQVPGGHAYVTTQYHDATDGALVLEKIVVSGMDHAWSGGASGASYADALGPDATALAWSFLSGAPVAPVDAGVSSVDAATRDAASVVDAATTIATSDAGQTKSSGGGCSMTPHATSPWAVLVLLVLCVRKKRLA